MRRLLIVLAVVAVLAAAFVAALVIHRLQQEHDVRGSSTVEFTTTRERPVRQPLTIPWPEYGFDATRTRAVTLALHPPYRPLWRYHAGSLVEFPPAIGYGR